MSYQRPIGNKHLTWGRTGKRGGRRACLCENDTYKIECCQGYLLNQGIGDVYGGND